MIRLRYLLSALLLPVFSVLTAATPGADPVLEVKGRLIDIREVQPGVEAYPQYRHQRFSKSLPARIDGSCCAVSLREFDGPTAVRAEQRCELLVGVCNTIPDSTRWHFTGETFLVGKTRYKLFSANYDTPKSWYPLPPGGRHGASTMLFGKKLRVAETATPPGVVVAQNVNFHKSHITNPNITILPDGSYLATCSGSTPARGAVSYRSTDRGVRWERISSGSYPINFYSLFVHDRALYMMGTSAKEGNVIICRSTDNGRTWTSPDEGILLQGRYHSAPVPLIEHAGRIWRAMETNTPKEPRRAFVLSAPIGSDLLQAASWTASEALASNPRWITRSDERGFRQWIEGNIVVTPDGGLANLLRVDEHLYGRSAALIHIRNARRLDFDPKKDILEMPGGGKKFTVRYDSLSGRYWSLTSTVLEPFRTMRHGGIYAEGIHCGLIRNTLALISSADLRQWRIERIVMQSDNPFFDGFQYADWCFEREDIIAVVRTAMEEPRGLPVRQHDANYLLFKRIERFREHLPDQEPIRTLHKTLEPSQNPLP